MALIKTHFDQTSTADDVVAGFDLSGLRAVVTGGSSGIGLETARSLARAKADVTIAVRDIDLGRRAAVEIAETTDGRSVQVELLDLADRQSIDRFVATWRGPLHLLVANAGIMSPLAASTDGGWDMHLAVNHLGHFALALGLHAALVEGANQRGEARIVAVSSSSHAVAPMDFDDPHFLRRPYDFNLAYGQSKTANVLFAVEATRRWASEGIVANAVNPGAVATQLMRDLPELDATINEMAAKGLFYRKTPQQGAATTLVAAILPEFGKVGGRYLDDCAEAETIPDDLDEGLELHRVRRWALDPHAARRLWELSLDHLKTGVGEAVGWSAKSTE